MKHVLSGLCDQEGRRVYLVVDKYALLLGADVHQGLLESYVLVQVANELLLGHCRWV